MTTSDENLAAIQAVLDTPECHPILDKAVRLYLGGAISNIIEIVDLCRDAATVVVIRYPEFDAQTLAILIGELIPKAGEGWLPFLDAPRLN